MVSAVTPFYGMLCLAEVDPASPSPTVLPELHLNLWEKEESIFLDIGLMLDIKEPATRFKLYFPWALPAAQHGIEDLSEAISTPMAVPAVFNESWSITRLAGSRGATVSDQSEPLFAIVDIDSAWQLSAYNGNANELTIDIAALKARSQKISAAAPKLYVRFRVSNVPKAFYCVGIAQRDKNWVSSWQSTEIIDFRLNVRRGVPIGLERDKGKFVEFSKVHLFLMRGREQDIVFEDKLFKACRSLEDEKFWAGYSSQSAEQVQKSIGYQWSAKTDSLTGKAVKEFGILARFKKVEFGIRKFLIFALLLGAMGNAAWDGAKLSWDLAYGAWKSRAEATANGSESKLDREGSK